MASGGFSFVLQRASVLEERMISPALAPRDGVLQKLTIRPSNLPSHRFGLELSG
jgi:hypothetical protein